MRIFAHRKLIFVIVLMCAMRVSAQEPEKLNIALKINPDIKQFSGKMIASATNGAVTYTDPASNGLGKAPGEVLIKIEPADAASHTYRILVDADGNGDLGNDTAQVALPNSSVTVKINRKSAIGATQTLPYLIDYSRDTDRNRQARERFLWFPNYRAEGKLKTKNCEALLSVLDLTNDGQFDADDSAKGTNIGLDRNGDGRIWGKDEYLKGEQIIEYCGEAFLIQGLALDGTSITLVRTALRVPKIGEQLPGFVLTLESGKTLDSSSLKNKVHLLDFWASWCKPCVEKFTLVKQLDREFKKDVSIIAVNVDEKESLPVARQITKNYDLAWPHVMSGLGEADTLWKMFGAMRGNRLSIPLYVLIDAEGRLRYAGNGAEDLSDLRVEIKRLLSEKVDWRRQ